MGKFIQNVILELKLVEWWSFKDVVKSTILVIALTIVLVLFLTGTDTVFVQLRSLLLNRVTI